MAVKLERIATVNLCLAFGNLNINFTTNLTTDFTTNLTSANSTTQLYSTYSIDSIDSKSSK